MNPFARLPEDLCRESDAPDEAPTRPDACSDLRRIQEVLPQLGRVEIRGVRILVERLLVGQQRHGYLALRDGRDWRQERGYEHADGLWYDIFEEMERLLG